MTEAVAAPPSWLEERSAGIGASESAALMGFSPWATPLSLFLEKTGRLKRPNTPDVAERLQWGNLLEPIIIEELVARTRRGRLDFASWSPKSSAILSRPHRFFASGREVTVEHFIVRRKDAPHILATPDFAFEKWASLPSTTEQIQLDGPGWGEAKNASSWAVRSWRGRPPLYYQTQVQHQILAGPDLAWGCLGVLVGGNELRIIDMGRHGPFQRLLEDRIGRFWDYHVQKDIPPDALGTENERKSLASAFPEEEGIAVLPPEFEVEGNRIEKLKADYKRLEAEILAFENKIRLAIGTASCAVVDGGRACWSWKTSVDGSRRFRRMKDGSLVARRKVPKGEQ